MLLGGVQVPSAVITAWEEGRLVLFTGAGVSMAPPSDLPNFLGLAQLVAVRLQSSLDPEDQQWVSQLDTFMDVLDQAPGADVHALVKRVVTKEGSLPNANHDALARIATKFTPRLVTTNYDRHLEMKLVEHTNGSESVEVFRGPAMPLGDDFEGLVYLHGSAQDDASRLIVTDRDFSGAYFHSAWAARFLERMFRKYVVLFVGYSHSDVVMKYLSLGLGPDAQRFVITDKPNDPIWDRLRVHTIEYPENDHEVLTTCLTAWADLGEMGLLDHHQRVRELVSTTSDLTPDELSYLDACLSRPDRVNFICQYATDVQWVKWASGHGEFAKVFDRSAPQDPVTERLAHWFAETYATLDDGGIGDVDAPSSIAWTTFAEAGGRLSTSAWNALGAQVHKYKNQRPTHVSRWLWVLMEEERPGCTHAYLDHALLSVDVWDERDLALALLAHLMTPHLVPESGWGSTRMGVETRGDLHWLDEAWQKKYHPDIEALAPVLFPVVEAALVKHLNLIKTTGSRHGGLRRRSAIQKHPQDEYREPIDAVIDAVRDSAVALWTTDAEFVRRVIERWLVSGHVMLRRLAVHVAGEAPDATPDDLVKFILDHDLQSAGGVSQEVQHLLGRVTPSADSDLVDKLVSAWAPDGDEEGDLYRSFLNLEWLERNNVDNVSLSSALADLRAKLPDDIKGSEYPGMTSWMVVGSGEGEPPMSVDEFDRHVSEDPKGAVDLVLSFDEQTFPRRGETTREDAVSMLREVVSARPSAGWELWPYMADLPDLQGAVVAAWGHTKDQGDAEAVMNILAMLDPKPVLHGVGQFLIHADRSGGAQWEKLQTTDMFIEHVWDACETEEVFERGTARDRDWMSKTINAPAGLLMDFWFEMFRRRWAAALAVDAWRGLGEQDREFLERVMADRTERGAFAVTQIAGRLHFMDSADSTWTRRHLLPLRDWADPVTAEPFWWGVLSYARWNSGLVADGLLEGLLETAGHLDAFTGDQRRRWASILGSIAVRCEAPSAAEWVDRLAGRSEAEGRVQWLSAVGEELSELDDSARYAAWVAWLAAYWKSRNVGDPVTLTRDEATALASLAPHVSHTAFEDAVTLVEGTKAGLGSHGDAARNVSDELLAEQPAAVARFLTHLMKNTSQPFWGGYSLVPLLERLIGLEGDWTALREAALRLGISLD